MQVLNFNSGIDFGANGNLREFSPVGFSPFPDDVSTWTQAEVAELGFRLPLLHHDLRFAIEVFPFLVQKQLTEQTCWVFFNGLFAHYQTIRAPVDLAFTIGRDLLSQRVNRLSFILPNATAPRDLKIGDDVRLLGLAFVKLSAGDARAPAPVSEPAANGVAEGAAAARLAPTLGVAARRVLAQSTNRDGAGQSRLARDRSP